MCCYKEKELPEVRYNQRKPCVESTFHRLGSKHDAESSRSIVPRSRRLCFHTSHPNIVSQAHPPSRLLDSIPMVVNIEAIHLAAIRRTLAAIYNPLALCLNLIPLVQCPLTSTALAPLLTNEAAAQHRQTAPQTAAVLLLLLHGRRLLVLHLLALRRVVGLLLRGAVLHLWALGVLAAGRAVARVVLLVRCRKGLSWNCVYLCCGYCGAPPPPW